MVWRRNLASLAALSFVNVGVVAASPTGGLQLSGIEAGSVKRRSALVHLARIIHAWRPI